MVCIYIGISLIVVRINLKDQPVSNDVIMYHNDGSSFVLPRSVLVAAQKENYSYCKYLLLVMVAVL